MKINPKINKRVNDSVAECRKVLINTTIELLKKIAEPGQDVLFDRTLIIHQTNKDFSETFIADRIAYSIGRSDSEFYIISMEDEDEFCKSDIMLSLSNLQVIYEEVRKIIRKY